MFGRKRSDEELIYADPAAGEAPMVRKRRGLRITAAVLIAVVLVAIAVAVLLTIDRGQSILRLPGTFQI